MDTASQRMTEIKDNITKMKKKIPRITWKNAFQCTTESDPSKQLMTPLLNKAMSTGAAGFQNADTNMGEYTAFLII